MDDEVMMHCPCCGAEISARSAACPECGSDERTGWSEKTYLDGVDLGIDDDCNDDDYEDMKQREFSEQHPHKHHVFQWIIGGILLLAFLIAVLRSYF